MCVGTQNRWFVHSYYTCVNHHKVLAQRPTPLTPSGTVDVGGHTLYFYNVPLQGWDTAENRKTACKCKK